MKFCDLEDEEKEKMAGECTLSRANFPFPHINGQRGSKRLF